MNSNILTEYDDKFIINILQQTKNIAMVGLSSDWNRPSYFVAKYLTDRGYNIFPVNPKEKNKHILGKRVYSNLNEIENSIDMVDIFRNSEGALEIVKEAIDLKPSTIWMQIGIINQKAEQIAKKNRIKVIMNRCPKIEFCRLSGELGWAGINSGLFSNKRNIVRPIY